MSADLNTVTLVGRLTRDPELRDVADTCVLTGRLAFTRREKRDGEWADTANYTDVTLAWGNRAEALHKILTKGSRIAITGSLRYREWQTGDGSKRSTLDIDARDVQVLDSRQPRDEPERTRRAF